MKKLGGEECTEDERSQMTTQGEFSHAFFSVPVRKTKMNETRETKIASHVVFLQFSFFPYEFL